MNFNCLNDISLSESVSRIVSRNREKSLLRVSLLRVEMLALTIYKMFHFFLIQKHNYK